MLTRTTETNTPVYSLEQSGRDGSAQFEISDDNPLTKRQKELFFIPHRQSFYKLVYLKEGMSRHWVDMEPYETKPDTLYFISPEQTILKENSSVAFKGSVISFTEEFLGLKENRMLLQLPLIRNPYNGHSLKLSCGDIIFMDDITSKLLKEYRLKPDMHNSMLSAYLQIMLIYLSRLYTAQFTGEEKSGDRELLKKFKTLISENFATAHEVAEYAEMLNLSAGHFSEMIKEQSGKTAIEHIHERLLMEAKRMLFHSDQSAKEIAFELGFEDASYFNRFFKRLANTTPLSYRNNIREMYR